MIKKQILEAIKKHKNFLISAHINPEGDSIGSQLALAQLLKKKGKTVRIINHDKVPQNLLFLPGAENIEVFAQANTNADECSIAVIVDCPSLERLGNVKQLLGNKLLVNIDHHVSNENFGSINWVDQNVSAAGELIYALYESSKLGFDAQSALCLYVAIMTDTGSFRYSNTTANTHRVIAELLNYDINPAKVYQNIYENKSFDNMKLLGEILTNLNRSEDGKIVWFAITEEMLKKHELTAENTDDFVDLVRKIDGTEIIVFLRELDNKKAVKVSLRSKSDVDVNKIARVFGGGGHHSASGCVIEENLDKAASLLLEQIKKSMNNIQA